MAVYTANQLNVGKDEFEHWQQSETIKKNKGTTKITLQSEFVNYLSIFMAIFTVRDAYG